ncbi:MAG: putative Holliday junction resolvase YggF [Pseudonocardiales bacterium]|nr:putative Holliday junction resolvase YggF [Pseudonocardiales bacterium]
MTEPARAAGVWLGIDVGTVRVGVARSDPRGVLAVPVATLQRDKRRNSDLEHLEALCTEYEVVGVVVGMPMTMAGRRGKSAEMASTYGAALARRITPVPIVYMDERLSTVSATRTLSAQGRRGPAGRAVVDQVAAVEILQRWLDAGSFTDSEDS